MRPRRFANALTAAALLATWLCAAPAGAEQLVKLNVTSFTMQSDTLRPQVGTPFHIIFSIHVGQSVAQLQNVVLPAFGLLEIDGDEQHLNAGPSGTDYREVVTVVAHQAGHVSIGSASMDAIDRRDGKPKRFLSTTPAGKDTIELDIVGGPPSAPPIQPVAEHLFLRALSFIAGLLVVAFLAILVLVRRKPRMEPPVAPPPSPPQPVAPPVHTFGDLLADLRAAPTRAQAVRTRAEIWESIAAPEGATLGDVLAMPAAREPRLRAVLQAAERAAFTHDGDFPTALDELAGTLEAYDR